MCPLPHGKQKKENENEKVNGVCGCSNVRSNR